MRTPDPAVVYAVTNLLFHPCLAAVGHGLVERLEVFEFGLVALLGGCAEVFVEPLVAGTPRFRIFLAELLGETCTDVRMRIERHEQPVSSRFTVSSFAASRPLRQNLPIVVSQPGKRFGEAGNGLPPQGR